VRESSVEVTTAKPVPGRGALLAVPVPSHGSPADILERLDEKFGLALAGLIRPDALPRDEGAVEILRTAPGIALVGLGDIIDEDAVRNAAAGAARAARAARESLVWAFDDALLAPASQVRCVVEGVLLGTHEPARWKTGPAAAGLERLVIAGAPDGLELVASRSALIAGWTNRARELVDAPPNELTPAGLGAAVLELVEGLAVEVEVLDLAGIERAGLRALATVGRGSANEPRLIVLRYRSASAAGEPLGLVGKGVTFDSGGLFLKPQSDIVKQKADMGGAACVIAAVGAVAELGLDVGIVAVIPAAENLIDGAAYRPGDILTMASGLTVEVTNPDAEGRLLLADGIWYVRNEGATRVIDVATLTGAMRTGMGDMYAGVFANEPGWGARIVAAGEASGDHAWPWPMHRRYDEPMLSRLADLRNTAGKSFGYPIFAAAFLRRFAGETPWAHIDIHSSAYLDEGRGYLGAGATGAGVRLLVELASGLSPT
jgi:leucyl aminopeptidase